MADAQEPVLPQTLDLPGAGTDLALDEARGVLYVAVPSVDAVLAFDTTTGALVDQIDITGRPHQLDLAASGDRLYVALDATGSVAVVDLTVDFVVADIDVFDISAELGGEQVGDIAEIGADRVLVAGGFRLFTVTLNVATGEATRTASEQSLSGPSLARVGSDMMLVGEQYGENLFLLDLTQPDVPVIAERVLDDVGETAGVAVSADASTAYVNGKIVRTSDLAVIGTTPDSGSSLLSADGALLVQRGRNQVSVTETATLRTVERFSSNCDIGQTNSVMDEAASVLFSLSSLGSSVCVDLPTNPPGSISGQVTDADTNEPLVDAQVCATAWNTKVGSCTSTDGDGQYLIQGLRRGTQNVRFGAAGYWTGCAADCSVVVSSRDTISLDAALRVRGPAPGWDEGAAYLGDLGHDLAFDAARNLLYVSIPRTRSIVAIDPADASVVDVILVGGAPRGIDLSPAGDKLYAALENAGAVIEVDLVSREVREFSVLTELDTAEAWDVVAVANDRLVVSGGYVASVDLTSGDASRVASGQFIGDRANLRRAGDASVLVGGRGLYRLDLTRPGIPVVAEATDNISEPTKLTTSADGQTVYGFAQTLRTSDLEVIGTTSDVGYPTLSPDGMRLMRRSGTELSILDLVTGRVERIQAVCGGSSIEPTAAATNGSGGVLFSLDRSTLCVDQPQGGTGSIAGRVATLDGDPINNAQVCASSENGVVGACARTDNAGAYVITGLRVGSYRVQAAALGFVSECYQDQDCDDVRPPLPVSLSPVGGIDIALAPTTAAGGWGSEDLLPGYSHDFVLDEARGRLYVSMPGQRGIAVIDSIAGELLDHVLLVGEPRGVELSMSGSDLYVALADLGSVAVIDLDSFDHTLIDVSTELDSLRASDVLQVDAQRLLVASNDYLVSVNPDTGVARRIAGDRQIGLDPTFERAGPDSVIAVQGSPSPDFYRIDITQSAMPIVAQSARDLPGGDQVAISPDGTTLYTGRLVLQTSDLSVIGTSPSSGSSQLSPDGATLIQVDRTGLVVVSDTQSSRQLDGFSSVCESPWRPQTAIDSTGLLLFSVYSNSACVDSLGDPSGSLAGRVAAAEDGRPLQGARVCASPVAIGKTSCSTTNAFGRYVIDSLRPGPHRVQFVASGYVPQCHDQVACGAEASVDVGEFVLIGVDAALERAQSGVVWGVGPQLSGNGHDLVLDERRGVAYVSTPSSKAVAVVSTSTGRVVDELLFAGEPRGLALSEDGSQLYVALWSAGAVGVVDLNTRESRLVFVDIALIGDNRTWDVLEIEPGQVLVSASPRGNGSARLVSLDAATGHASSIAGGATFQYSPVFTRAGDDGVLVSQDTDFSLARLDLTQPEIPVSSYGALSLFAVDLGQPAVAADGETAYVTDSVIRTSDLTRIADLPSGGLSALTPDGQRLIQRSLSWIATTDPQSLRRLEGYSSACVGEGAVAQTAIDSGGDTLFTIIGSTLCADSIVEGSGSISGRLSVRESGDPIVGARACVFGTNTRTKRCSLTDADGFYTVGQLRADTYSVDYLTGGFESLCPSGADCSYLTGVSVADIAVTEVDFQLDPLGADSAWGYPLMLSDVGHDAVLDAARGRIYVSQPYAGSIAVVDTSTGLLIEEIELRGAPHGMDLAAGGDRLLVALGDVGSVAVVDLVTNEFEEFYVGDRLLTPDAFDVLDIGGNRALVSAAFSLDATDGLVLLDLVSGDRRRVAGGFYGDVTLARAGAASALIATTSSPRVTRVDLTDPDIAIVPQDLNFSIRDSEQMVVSADGETAYFPQQVVRVDDLFVTAQLSRVGRPALTPDGSRLIQRSDDGMISISDTETLDLIDEFRSTCQVRGMSEAVMVDPAGDRLFSLVGGTICMDRLDGLGGTTPFVSHTVSCLAGNGRVDTNIVNRGRDASRFRIVFEGLSPREATVPALDWWRMPITGRPDGLYSVFVFRDGVQVSVNFVNVLCDEDRPQVSPLEVEVINACRFGNGYLLFQLVNQTAETRGWVIEFGSIPNRSTSARGYAASVRAVTGRPDGDHDWRVRVGGTYVASGTVAVDCDS